MIFDVLWQQWMTRRYICLYYVIIFRDRLYVTISRITATKIFTIEEADTVTVYPTEFHVRMSRLFAENVAAWKTQFPLSLITFWPSPYTERRWPRRIVGADRGKSLLNNRAETLQLPRGRMITPCVQRYINELRATRVCLFVGQTRILIQ